LLHLPLLIPFKQYLTGLPGCANTPRVILLQRHALSRLGRHRRQPRRDDRTPNIPIFSKSNVNSLEQIDIRQIRRRSPHDRNKNDSNEGKAHVDGRSTVSRANDSIIDRFCRGPGKRNVVGAKLGEKEREMISGTRRRLYWRDIAAILAVKLVMLTCLYLLFFGPSHRPPADSAAVAARVLGPDR
jgi:hypothetical protein